MRSVAIALALAALAASAPADAVQRPLRLRWLPSATPGVVGYRVYARPASSGGWDAPTDVGVPTPGGDGTLATTLPGFESTIEWVLAVSAVGTGGAESARSNTIVVPASGAPSTTTTTSTSTSSSAPGGGSTLTTTTSTTSTTAPRACAGDADCDDGSACTSGDACVGGFCRWDPVACEPGTPCAPGRCDPAAGCVVEPVPPGTPCDLGDPCQPGVCSEGGCVAPAAQLPAHFLSVSRFVIRESRRGARLLARASFALTAPLDPAVSGVAFEVSAPDGRLLHAVSVPPEAFAGPRRRGRRLRYRLARRAARDLVPDVRRVVLLVDQDVADVALETTTQSLARSRTEPALRWVVRAGAECVRDLGLACAEDGERTVCE
jgi:hypothetical protein